MKIIMLLLCLVMFGCPSDFGGEHKHKPDATESGRQWTETKVQIDDIKDIPTSTTGP